MSLCHYQNTPSKNFLYKLMFWSWDTMKLFIICKCGPTPVICLQIEEEKLIK